MVDADAHPAFVVVQIIDAEGDRLALLGQHKVVNAHLLGLSFGLPLPARVPAVTHQLLLLRVHRHRGLAPRLLQSHLLVEVREPCLAGRLPAAFFRLAVGLQTVAQGDICDSEVCHNKIYSDKKGRGNDQQVAAASSARTAMEMVHMSPTNTERNPTSTTNYRRPLPASTMIGAQVKNREDETLGTLHEIMIDVQSSRIAYGVLESGSFLGMGGKLLAIPFEAFTIDERDHTLVLDVINKEVITNAEGFDKNNWPDFASQEWAQRTYSYYGYEPYFDRQPEDRER